MLRLVNVLRLVINTKKIHFLHVDKFERYSVKFNYLILA